MKRMIVLIVAAVVIPIGVLQAVDCEFDITYVDTMDCHCSYNLCGGLGYFEVIYDCPSEGDCPACEYCWARLGGRFPNIQFVYGEPDCFTWDYGCDDPEIEPDCSIEGYDEDTMVYEDVGNCTCWDFQ